MDVTNFKQERTGKSLEIEGKEQVASSKGVLHFDLVEGVSRLQGMKPKSSNRRDREKKKNKSEMAKKNGNLAEWFWISHCGSRVVGGAPICFRSAL